MAAITTIAAYAPGRVNLIGEHTDYNRGLALPMAIDLGVELRWRPNLASPTLRLRSSQEDRPAVVPLAAGGDLARLEPPWARYPAAVAHLTGLAHGGEAEITSTLPQGAGLSSSAALCVACALAFGEDPGGPNPDPVSMARLCQRAEALVGVEVGLMDPLVSMVGAADHAVLVDFSTLQWRLVPVPRQAQIVVVHSGERRGLSQSPYAERRRQCALAARTLGPLGQADEGAIGSLPGVLAKRARHVITECRRVRQAASALAAGDLVEVGRLMDQSHRSLSDDFEASTPAIDELVGTLRSLPGVWGARLTGGGFGGCVVALCQPGALGEERWPKQAFGVKASAGARLGSRS